MSLAILLLFKGFKQTYRVLQCGTVNEMLMCLERHKLYFCLFLKPQISFTPTLSDAESDHRAGSKRYTPSNEPNQILPSLASKIPKRFNDSGISMTVGFLSASAFSSKRKSAHLPLEFPLPQIFPALSS